MTDKNQLPLFTEVPAREYQSGSIATWKDQAVESSEPTDEFDRLDAQGQRTMGQIALESSGMSRRETSRRLNAGGARVVMDEIFKRNDTERMAEEEERKKKADEKFRSVMRETRID